MTENLTSVVLRYTDILRPTLMNSLCELDILQPIKTTCVCRHQCASTSFRNLLQTNWTNSKTVCWVHKVCLPLCSKEGKDLRLRTLISRRFAWLDKNICQLFSNELKYSQPIPVHMERVVLSFCMIANINKVTKLSPETIDIEVCKDLNFFA